MQSNEQQISNYDQELITAVGELTITAPPDTSSVLPTYTTIRRVLDGLLKVIKRCEADLEDMSVNLVPPTKKPSPAAKKSKSEVTLSPDLLRPECRILVNNFQTFTITNLKKAISNMFDKDYLRTDLSNISQIGLTQEEYDIHCQAMDDPDLISCAITEKDIPVIIQRLFQPPSSYTVTTESGSVIPLDISSFIGKSRREVLSTLDVNKWIAYRVDNSGTHLERSPYLMNILAQVPGLQRFNLAETSDRVITGDQFLKYIDIVRDTHEIYFSAASTEEARQLIAQLELPLINNSFKLSTLEALAKKKKFITTFRDAESLKRTIMGITEVITPLIH